jgi:hypothetical protein
VPEHPGTVNRFFFDPVHFFPSARKDPWICSYVAPQELERDLSDEAWFSLAPPATVWNGAWAGRQPLRSPWCVARSPAALALGGGVGGHRSRGEGKIGPWILFRRPDTAR